MRNNQIIPQALTIASTDSGGGAGIGADIKTFQMRRVFGCLVVASVTAQNTLGVFDIHQLSSESITAQLQAVSEDFNIQACKIGMLGDAQAIEAVAQGLKKFDFGTVVLDPVMVAKSGAVLLADEALSTLKNKLLPLADIITPNLQEAVRLTNLQITNAVECEKAARIIQGLGVHTVIIKGGHSENSTSEHCVDWVFSGDNAPFSVQAKRYHTRHTHGTGCTFSACLTAELAKGVPLLDAVQIAKDFITTAISTPLDIGSGSGPVNHWAYQDLKR